MNVTWLGIVVLAILILCVWRGYSRGFIKEIVSFSHFNLRIFYPRFLSIS